MTGLKGGTYFWAGSRQTAQNSRSGSRSPWSRKSLRSLGGFLEAGKPLSTTFPGGILTVELLRGGLHGSGRCRQIIGHSFCTNYIY